MFRDRTGYKALNLVPSPIGISEDKEVYTKESRMIVTKCIDPMTLDHNEGGVGTDKDIIHKDVF